MIGRPDVHHAMCHGHGRVQRVFQFLRNITADRHFVGTRWCAPLLEHHRSCFAKTIALKEICGGTNHTKPAMTVTQRIRHGPFHGGMRPPSLKRFHRHRTRRRPNTKHGAQQHLQRTTTRTNDQIGATDGTRKTFAHSGAQMFDTNQQRDAERNRRDCEPCRQHTTLERLRRQAKNQAHICLNPECMTAKRNKASVSTSATPCCALARRY